MQTACHLPDRVVVADIGAGTGIFTALLLQKGYSVYAVEPNEAMQSASIDLFKENKNFHPINGTAEATSLDSKSVDLVVCAQAFHWFDAQKTQVEFKRILKDGGYVALIWNNRDALIDEFSIAYENILKNDAIDYNKVNHRNINEIDFKAFFKDGLYQTVKYPNVQVFDEAGFLGRAFSSSYVPQEGTIEGGKFKELLKLMFAKYNKNGMVSFYYQTEIYLGKV